MTQELTLQTPCALHTPSRRTWRIRRSGVYPQPILSPGHAGSVAFAAAALLHAAVMLAAGAVFPSCCRCVRATGYGLACPSNSEWVDIWRIEGLLTQTLYRNGCIRTSNHTTGWSTAARGTSGTRVVAATRGRALGCGEVCAGAPYCACTPEDITSRM